ncbi:hypothetical protein EDB80DRAFT_742755, partial [Ilyonectria destructans]
RNCHTCKQDLPEVEFRSVKDPTKFTRDCDSCRARRRERVAESRAAVAAMRNIALRLSPRRATKRTDSLANLTPPRRAAPTPASVHGLQPPATPALFLLGTPIPQTPIPQGTLPTAPVVLGTPLPQESFPTTPSLLSQSHRRGRYTRQGAHAQERQFDQIVDPPFTGDLNLPALSEEDQALVREFYTALNDDKMHSCIRCREHWFDMKRNSLKICSRCIS